MSYEITLFSNGAYAYIAMQVQAGAAGIGAGQVCCWSQAEPGRIVPVPTGGNEHNMPIGIAVGDFVADAWGWLAIAGVVAVLPISTVTAAAGYVLVCSNDEAGRAEQRATMPPALSWNVVGHWIENGAGPGLAARAMVHFK